MRNDRDYEIKFLVESWKEKMELKNPDPWKKNLAY